MKNSRYNTCFASSESSEFLSLDEPHSTTTTEDQATMVSRKRGLQDSSSSSDSQQPQIHEISSSSESQHKPQLIYTKPQHQKSPFSAGGLSHIKSYSDGVMTANLVYVPDAQDAHDESDFESDVDKELQAVVEMVIQGGVPQTGTTATGGVQPLPQHPHYNRGKALIAPYPRSTFIPASSSTLDMARDSARHRQSPLQQQQQHSQQQMRHRHDKKNDKRTKRKTLSMKRFASPLERQLGKRKVEQPTTAPEKNAKCSECAPFDPSKAGRLGVFLYPAIRWLQERPLAAFSIALGVLVVLLIVIIVIVIVGVLPNLMRAIVQDLSLTMTSVHAIPPPEYSGLLLPTESQLGTLPTSTVTHNARMLTEPDPRANEWSQEAFPLTSSAFRFPSTPALVPMPIVDRVGAANALANGIREGGQQPSSSAPPSAAVVVTATALSSPVRASIGLGSAAVSIISGSHPNRPLLFRRQNIAHESKHADTTVHEDVAVTVTHTSTSTLRIPRFPVSNVYSPLATNAGAVVATIANTQPALQVLPLPAATSLKDLPLTSEKYMMQVSGNMTSGGPIGVTIQFTEPLRLFWRDIEIGIVEHPETIRVPGKGTTEWSWPPFEVTIPGNMASTSGGEKRDVLVVHTKTESRLRSAAPHSSLVTLGKDRVAEGGVAQRRDMAGSVVLGRSEAVDRRNDELGDLASDESLADWFAAIQSHRSFTMQWKSRVRVSALGLHTSEITFDKSVKVLCGETKNCTITGPSLI
ncbi:hypothetical protein GQ54DRAFT_65006 [Martensiomyces pterosporus]|nr:hypothetical protein GQ54DRAFT_65006 [Martensiomyces pterosporus]